MVQILYQDLSKSDSNYYYIGIPKDWSGATDNEVTVIVDDVCVIVPQTIAGATGAANSSEITRSNDGWRNN